MTVRLTLICHASTRALREAVFPTDESLEPQGFAKASALASKLLRIDSAWSSPALRAVQTASALGLAANADSPLSDIDMGMWAGRSLAEVTASDPVGLASWMSDAAANPHGGETIMALVGRVTAWLDVVGRSKGRVVAITHPAIIRAAIVITLDAPPISFWRIDVAPLCFARLQGRAGRWTLRSLDQNPSDVAS
jgi:broad specificity phosphatase PhoE